ncbi:MAG: GlsB/YeaQ/YmgE family stress response membrane protein [Taibaiella sp.]|nr:GlsB/YeaQ/YmgE family stress response membrane protein [Taibaiella sp.]
MVEILIICLIGGIAGYLASIIVRSENDSLLLDIIIGIAGGYIGYRLFGRKLSFTGNIWIDKTVTATAGALLLALIIKLIRRAL